MVKHPNEFRQDIRTAPRGGQGTAYIYHMLEPEQYFNKGRMMAKAVLSLGSVMGYHVHENEMEMIYILSGQAKVNDNGVERLLVAGDMLYTGDGQGHSIEAVGDTDLSYLAVIISQ